MPRQPNNNNNNNNIYAHRLCVGGYLKNKNNNNNVNDVKY